MEGGRAATGAFAGAQGSFALHSIPCGPQSLPWLPGPAGDHQPQPRGAALTPAACHWNPCCLPQGHPAPASGPEASPRPCRPCLPFMSLTTLISTRSPLCHQPHALSTMLSAAASAPQAQPLGHPWLSPGTRRWPQPCSCAPQPPHGPLKASAARGLAPLGDVLPADLSSV